MLWRLLRTDVVSLSGYLSDKRYLGATVGRVANRIAKGRFVLEGKEYQLDINNGPNALHGGLRGFNKVNMCTTVTFFSSVDWHNRPDVFFYFHSLLCGMSDDGAMSRVIDVLLPIDVSVDLSRLFGLRQQ